MSEFLNKLIVTPLSDGKRWSVVEPFEYVVGETTGDEHIVVPVGFITDFASVPRRLWAYLPKWGRYGKASVVHDYLYNVPSKYSRRQADQIFLEGMRIESVNAPVRFLMYAAIRVFGWLVWRPK